MKDKVVVEERRKNFRQFIRRMTSRRIVIIGLIGTLFFIIVALFAPFIATHDPAEQSLLNTLADASPEHIFGTDMYGRDLFSRIVYGSRVSLIIGVSSVVIAAAVGSLLGMLAAYYGGIVDAVAMRFCDAFRAIPQIAVTTALVAIYGRTIKSMAVIMGLSSVPGFIRMMRASSLTAINSEYVLSARLLGESPLRIMIKHIFPNSVSPIIIMATQMIGGTIMMESGLSFLGIGITAPTASWGTIVDEARPYLLTHPLYAAAPCAAIALLIISLNLLGDGIRDALDPTLRGAK